MADRTSFTGDFEQLGYDDWRAVVDKTLRGAPFEKRLVTRTVEGIDVQPLYWAEDPPSDVVGFPGLPPYTRGGEALGASARGWTICQEYALASPDLTRQAIDAELARGGRALWIRCDAASRAWLDLDDPAAEDLRGRGGVLLSCREGLAQLLSGVDLGAVAVTLEGGSAAVGLAAMLVHVAGRRGLPPAALRGSLGCDPLTDLAVDGRLPCSLERALDLMSDLATWCGAEAPRLRAAHVSALPYQRAGASAVQELAYALATGVGYLRAMEDAGLSIEQAAQQLLFVFGVGRDLFMELAKLRAARSLWARLVAACGGRPEAQRMQLHARSCPVTRTVRDPWVNMLRGTTESFAAAAGGADSICCAPFDEAITEPDAFSARIAANLQRLLQEESHLHAVADPAGGSWYVESLTASLEREAWGLFQQIEAAGGMAAFSADYGVEAQVAATVGMRARGLATRQTPITGVSEFPLLDERTVQREAPDLAALGAEAELALQRQRSDSPAPTLEGLDEVEPGQGDAMRAALAAVAGGATLGDIMAPLRGQGPAAALERPLSEAFLRYAEPFEALRDAADARLATHGQRPQVFLANLGPVPQHKARAMYCTAFLAAGGFEAQQNGGFETPEAVAAAYAEAHSATEVQVAVICSTDKAYRESVPVLAPLLKQAGARFVLLAGRPGEQEAAWRASGVDLFIYMGCDVLSVLRDLQHELGVQS